MITLPMMRACGVSEPAAHVWLDPLNESAVAHDITTFNREAAWIANLSHECQGFTRMVENMNYSAERLMVLWPCTPKRLWGFTYDEARAYAHKPEQIANRVYANRYGNGPNASGDGWRYRGRGPSGLTFRDNYAEMGEAFQVPLVMNPELAREVSLGALIAGRFWQTRGCNELADMQDDEGVRRKINGGTNGLDDVIRRMEAIEQAVS
jgi:putative chitinase